VGAAAGRNLRFLSSGKPTSPMKPTSAQPSRAVKEFGISAPLSQLRNTTDASKQDALHRIQKLPETEPHHSEQKCSDQCRWTASDAQRNGPKLILPGRKVGEICYPASCWRGSKTSLLCSLFSAVHTSKAPFRTAVLLKASCRDAACAGGPGNGGRIVSSQDAGRL